MRACAFSFMPHILLQAATEQVLKKEIEKRAPRMHSVLEALERADMQVWRMQSRLQQELHRPLPVRNDLTPATLTDLMRNVPVRYPSPWRALFGFRREFSRPDRRLIVRLTARERLAATLQRGIDDHSRYQPLHEKMRPAVGYWYLGSGLRLQQEGCILLDEFLEHLAWYESERSHSNPSPYPAGWASALAEPSQTPMRHWFDALLKEADCRDFPAFAQFLARKGVTHGRGEAVEAALLRKWACNAQPLTGENARTIAKAVVRALQVELEIRRFWVAKLLTFFGEVVYCFAQEPVAPAVIRTALHNRLVEMKARFERLEAS